jgi:outer membrane protein OmpA-like peptidoglycan-associated protein
VAGESRTQVWEPAVYFGFDQNELADAEARRLESNLAVLKQYPTLQVSVQAFTDEKGAASYNQKLAARRLDRVVQYLRDGGISNGRIKRVALGEELPILPDANNEQRVINRRVELMPLDAQSRPLVLRADFARSGGDEFVPPAPVK